jgi:hypothetical protein
MTQVQGLIGVFLFAIGGLFFALTLHASTIGFDLLFYGVISFFFIGLGLWQILSSVHSDEKNSPNAPPPQ